MKTGTAPRCCNRHGKTRYAVLIATGILAAQGALGIQPAGAEVRESPGYAPGGDVFDLPCDDATGAEIDGLVGLLGSPSYDARRRATERLTEIGIVAFSKLRAAFHRTDDLEVRLRIEMIVREAYMNRHVFGRFGFLGIRRRTVPGPTHSDDPRISKGRVGIVVDSVLPDTAAQRAGLRANDVITALDGEEFQGDAIAAFESFARAIRERGAGAKVTFTVLRPEETVQIEAVLGQAPKEGIGQVTGLQQQYIVAHRRLEAWWHSDFSAGDPSPRD